MPFCTTCNVSVHSKSWVGHLRSNSHRKSSKTIEYSDGVEIVSSAFRNRIVTYKILPLDQLQLASVDIFFFEIRNKLKSLLDENLIKHSCVKVNFELFGTFLKFNNNSQEIKSFGTKNKILHSNYDFEKIYLETVSYLKTSIEEFEDRDSGWTFLNNLYIEININKYQPLSGSSFISLPKSIQAKKACLNIMNKDQHCFLWSVTAALYPAKNHPERISSYPNFRELFNINGMFFPVTFHDIKIFEKNNPNIKFIIYGLKKSKTIVGPLYKSDINKTCNEKIIHLLYLENNNTSHYCLIKEPSRLFRSQVTSHHSKLYFCDLCLIFFSTSKEVENHLCGGVVTVLPNKGSVIKFKNYARKQNMPFCIYADFESMLQTNTEANCSSSKNTTTLHQHLPIAFGYYIVCRDDPSYNRYVSYRGPGCDKQFVDSILKDVQKIFDILSTPVPMIFSTADKSDFDNATRCHICENFIFSDKVRDHCHVTGRYRGAAHPFCNLQYKRPSFVPIFFHNLAGYDCHLFIKALGEVPGNIKIIPKTKENYISFTKFVPVTNNQFFQLRFVDSFKFLGTSLSKLSETLKPEMFKNLQNHFPDEDEFQLLTRKGIYPYEYMNSWKRYDEKSLPPKECFYSSLTDHDISDEDYQHACLIWSTFQIKDLGSYTDLYLKTDVLLLADIFENFRQTCKQHYQLDPAFYLTAPSLSFDAMLLKTGIQLELIDDLSMVRMLQSGIRGGVCLCSHRHAKANNPYLENYKPSESPSYVTYIDCNNLYGYSMCQYLPLSDFRFLNEQEINKLNVTEIPIDAECGYILEVDLQYPKHLHNLHNDLPFCSEKCIPPGGKTFKLVPNLYDKFKYVIHYIHLQTCLKHGLILKKIHRVISFRQSPYLKQYIDLNTALRQKSSSTFEQDFFKLLNNSVFGKTLENNEKRVNVHLVNQWVDNNNVTKKRQCAQKLIARPNFHSVTIFSENLVAVQLNSDQIILDKPIYIGFTVLELSKSHMYNFHYSVIKPFYKNNVQMCYTDTDSFVYHIRTHDFYDDIKKHFLPYFDTSNFCNTNQYDLPIQNKKVPGLFKDEMAGKIISEFVGLRSKLYCIKTINSTIKKAKGIKKNIVSNFNVTDYQKTLYEGNIVHKTNVLFKSIKHELYTCAVKKVALSGDDDKRVISKDKISTKSWGHTSIFNF
ncbi:uncharacterized protein LOC121738160 [Aricia agestis]|uniref:uncharacterized protein LOC121738160 n=1 Tax=Aricia agestis TaxID=91739 RepID=UPI001C2035E2|nr:uncharacterized protein LOC121738160 [Aricia agestis]